MILALGLFAFMAGQDSRPSVDDLRRGLQIRDATFRQAALQATFHQKRRTGRGAQLVTRVQTMNAVVNAAGHARLVVISRENVPDGPAQGVTRRYSETANAAGSRYYTAGSGAEPPNGWIKDARGLSWPAPILEILSITEYSPLKYLSSVRNLAIEGFETVDGREAVKLNWSFENEESGSGRRGTYWIAPSLGYAVVKSVEDSRVGKKSEWKLFRQKDLSGFREVGGLWFPEKATLVEHAYYVKDGGYELRQELVAEFSDWKVDLPIDDETFTLKFPKGTLVRDFLAGDRTYRAGAIGDPHLKTEVDQAKGLVGVASADLEKRFEEAIRRDNLQPDRPPWWIIALGSVIALALAGGVIGIRSVRHGRKAR